MLSWLIFKAFYFSIVACDDVISHEYGGTVYFFKSQERDTRFDGSYSSDDSHLQEFPSPGSSFEDVVPDVWDYESDAIPSYITSTMDLLNEDEFESWDTWNVTVFENAMCLGKRREPHT